MVGCACLRVKSLQSCPTLCDPMDCSPQAPLFMDSPGKNTGVGCSFFLPEIFPTQGSNPGLLKSPALAGRLFTTITPREAPGDRDQDLKKLFCSRQCFPHSALSLSLLHIHITCIVKVLRQIEKSTILSLNRNFKTEKKKGRGKLKSPAFLAPRDNIRIRFLPVTFPGRWLCLQGVSFSVLVFLLFLLIVSAYGRPTMLLFLCCEAKPSLCIPDGDERGFTNRLW